MNDRYLFRGKTIDTNEWVIGYYEESNGHSYINYEETIEKYGKSLKITRSKEVIPETISQSTGLKDKNKKLIFEGDIVERYSYYDDIWEFSYTTKCYGVIVWNTNDYCWNIKVNDELIPFNDYDWDISMVVGNIHDTPELLEVKE